MPFGALDRQPLGISLLQAVLERSGIVCRQRNFSFDFAEFIGVDNYGWIAQELPYIAFAGDWCFTASLYGSSPVTDEAYYQRILQENWRLRREDIERILEIRRLVEPFLTHCMRAEDWHNCGLIGFTSTFEQNIASLALAKRMKAMWSATPLAFGGANWEDVMGQELHRQFNFVDFACSGEADESFLQLVNLVLADRATSARLAKIAGIIYRKSGQTIATGPPRMVADMDQLPVPDYDDYFDQLKRSTVSSSLMPGLLLETSRGCWWGAKSHCRFCGLNGSTMAFRSKSPKRVLEEIEYLTGRWGIDQLEVVDNILDMGYFRDLLPALAQRPEKLQFFYETKANLKKEQVELLAKAGVTRIQPGIETMSDHVLQLMGKGTKALKNIELLKWCKQYHVAVDWNLLYGFPGETREDYIEMMRLLPAIRFLDPPGACGPIRLDRFSPYFTQPEAYGIHRVRPLEAYAYIYPFAAEILHNIAYSFEFDYTDQADPHELAIDTIEYADDWRQRPLSGSLQAVQTKAGRLLIVDSRAQRKTAYALEGLDRAAYLICDTMQSMSGIKRQLQRDSGAQAISDKQLRGFLDSLVANDLMVTDGTHYLSLAIEGSTPHSATSHAISSMTII